MLVQRGLGQNVFGAPSGPLRGRPFRVIGRGSRLPSWAPQLLRNCPLLAAAGGMLLVADCRFGFAGGAVHRPRFCQQGSPGEGRVARCCLSGPGCGRESGGLWLLTCSWSRTSLKRAPAFVCLSTAGRSGNMAVLGATRTCARATGAVAGTSAGRVPRLQPPQQRHARALSRQLSTPSPRLSQARSVHAADRSRRRHLGQDASLRADARQPGAVHAVAPARSAHHLEARVRLWQRNLQVSCLLTPARAAQWCSAWRWLSGRCGRVCLSRSAARMAAGRPSQLWASGRGCAPRALRVRGIAAAAAESMVRSFGVAVTQCLTHAVHDPAAARSATARQQDTNAAGGARSPDALDGSGTGRRGARAGVALSVPRRGSCLTAVGGTQPRRCASAGRSSPSSGTAPSLARSVHCSRVGEGGRRGGKLIAQYARIWSLYQKAAWR